MEVARWHIICEKDVGLFSLVQQVIGHIPFALAENRIPVALYRAKCCYWIEDGYRDRHNVWEYYFEPILKDVPASQIPTKILAHIRENPPQHEVPGYFLNDDSFVTNHFGDHRFFKGKTLKIPYKWDDPSQSIRQKASKIIESHVRPRLYIEQKKLEFYNQKMKGHFVIGVHMRATDVTDDKEHNIHRRGSYQFEAYVRKIETILKEKPGAKIFVATDSQKALNKLEENFPLKVIYASTIFHTSEKVSGTGPSGWVIPGYLAEDNNQAARNGEEAVIDYLLLSQCQYLIHNGSGLARTALLKNPDLEHYNIHSKREYIKKVLTPNSSELLVLLKAIIRQLLLGLRKNIKTGM